LETKGAGLDDDLWSARLLLDSPELIRLVHDEFLAAGADCIATTTYQATFEGFARRGLSDAQSVALMERAVRLACDTRDAFWGEPANREGRRKPLVAASVGPYGAYLADGSEYRGDYGLDEERLHSFHQRRWQVLAGSRADLLACETIPSLPETHALLRLMDETPDVWAWISFSCVEGMRLADGNALADAVRAADGRPNVAAIGVNCTAPERIADLIRVLRDHTDKPIVVYPNSGEIFDPTGKRWTGDAHDWVGSAAEWIRLGAAGVGGCCRTGPEDIARLRRILLH
jgi:homocysteine S-methyltransferase